MVQVPKSLLQLASFLSSFMYHSDANSPITGATGGGDPCISLFSSGPIATVSAVEACYNIFPATVNQKQSQITFMKQMFSIYPYTELAKNSHIHKGNIYPMKFNFMQELDQIPANPTIDTEYKLTQAILKLITKLEDGHVKYVPLCFMSYTFLQPFNLQPVYQKDNTIDIIIESPNEALPDLFLSYWKDALQGYDVASLIGARVVDFNGEDPVNFIQDVADHFSAEGHTPELRFNLQFQNYKGLNKNYTLELKDGSIVTLIFPWAAWTKSDLSTYASGEAWYNGTCSKEAFAKQLAGRGAQVESAGIAAPAINPLDSVQFISMKPILNDTDSFFYMMEDGVTGVFAHTTFMPTPPSPDQEANVTRKWVQNIAKGLQALENAGARRLVLDLSGNGGGLVAYGWHLMNYLFPHGNLKPLEYAFPLTPEINRIFENTTVAAKFFNGYRNLHGALIQNLTMELAAPGTKLIKGLSTPFTNHFLMDFDLTLKKSNMSTFSDFGSLKRAWDPKNVILLSNGLCGSTCAQFTTILRDQLRVRSVTYGGGNKRSKKGTRAFDGTSFAAGFIKKIIDIMILLSSTESEGLVDPPFWFNIDSQITFATSFSKAGKLPEVPIEWVVDTSDFWLNSSDLTLDNPESVYKAVLDAKIFSSEHGSTRTKAFRKVKSNKKQAWHRHHHAVDARNGKGVGH